MAMALQHERMVVRRVSGVDMLVGLWLIISPFVLGYAGNVVAMWNSIILGAIVVLLEGSREVGEGYRHSAASWVDALAGLWLIISPFVLGFSFIPEATWNHVLSGVAVVILASWSALATPHNTTA